MRLHILSDLHLEFAAWTPPPTNADLVILAGDTHTAAAGVTWAARAFDPVPVVYVPGNHEYYGEVYPAHLHALRRAARGTCVHVLDRGVLTLPGLRVLGCTLWTDFDLHGDRRAAMQLAASMMWDYQQIEVAPRRRPARPADSRRWHGRARAWLAAAMAAGDGPTVVVTHHAPDRGAVSEAPEDRPYGPAYASDLADLIAAHGPALWVHGHTHGARDVRLAGTRIVSNPRGYPDERGTGFVPDLQVAI